MITTTLGRVSVRSAVVVVDEDDVVDDASGVLAHDTSVPAVIAATAAAAMATPKPERRSRDGKRRGRTMAGIIAERLSRTVAPAASRHGRGTGPVRCPGMADVVSFPVSGNPIPDPTALVDAIGSVVLGDRTPIRLAVAAFLAGGHVLVEDTPGVGKTLLARALSQGIGGSFARIQGTADLLPTEITGVSVFDPSTTTWAFREGPVFANVVVVDELNRATPRAQSALLEAMAEGQVSADGASRSLPRPFFVVATQNPSGDAGTFPLVSGQRDRFAVSISLGIPSPEAERDLLLGTGGTGRLRHLRAHGTPEHWARVRTDVAEIHVEPSVADYVLAVVHHLRALPDGSEALSPRAALAVVQVARGWAALGQRDYVLPDDVKAVAPAVLGHRLDAAASPGGPGRAGWSSPAGPSAREGAGTIRAGAAVVERVLGVVAAPPR